MLQLHVHVLSEELNSIYPQHLAGTGKELYLRDAEKTI
jgi:hypothetical protein